MKKLSILLFICGFLLIFSGVGIGFISSLKEDRTATLERMESVKVQYRTFSDSIDTFNDLRNSLYLNVFENVYIDTMATNDLAVKEMFSTYEESVNGVMNAVLELSNLCGDIYFFDNNINDKCSSYGNVYEQVVNAFVSDVSLYNGNISQYNEYQNGVENAIILENYTTNKDYIDYNNDKKFDGKEE